MPAKTINQRVGERVRLYRERRGLTPSQLAAAVGLHGRAAVWKYEHGTRTIGVDVLVAIARALEIPPSALVDGV